MFSPIILLGGLGIGRFLQSFEGHTSIYNSRLGDQKVLGITKEDIGRIQHNPKNGQKPMSQDFMENLGSPKYVQGNGKTNCSLPKWNMCC